ncbi:MAG: FAD-binding domain-containing protein [Bacteroidota bacterium]
MEFPTQMAEISHRVQQVNPENYVNTRNYKDGAVTYLSPYISRGVISTRYVYEHITTLALPWHKSEKLIQELAWRDYWQQVWIAKGEGIKSDLKHKQAPISNYEIPSAVVNASTTIEVVDEAIEQLYQTGYMHNHMRMYVASMCCNVANAHWLAPAKWMYYNLLDGDLASNYLSWQWVAGAFSNKKYYANQDNINTFFNSSQKNTFLDIDYEDFQNIDTPTVLTDTVVFDFETPLSQIDQPVLEKDKTTLIYNYYNIDPYWYQGEAMQRVFLMEPSFFAEHPVNQHCIDFAIDLTKNIEGIKIFVGEFSELQKHVSTDRIIFKEHPTNSHYKGREEPREWLSSVTGYFPSFFAFWKKCKRQLNS